MRYPSVRGAQHEYAVKGTYNASAGYGNVIDGNVIFDPDTNGIYVKGCQATVINNNAIQSPGLRAIEIDDAKYSTVSNNTILDFVGAMTYGILESNTNSTAASNKIVENTINTAVTRKISISTNSTWVSHAEPFNAYAVMTGDEALNLGSGDKIVRDPGGADRTLTPLAGTSAWPRGYIMHVYNIGGANKLVFAMGSTNVDITAGNSAAFIFCGTSGDYWRQLY